MIPESKQVSCLESHRRAHTARSWSKHYKAWRPRLSLLLARLNSQKLLINASAISAVHHTQEARNTYIVSSLYKVKIY